MMKTQMKDQSKMTDKEFLDLVKKQRDEYLYQLNRVDDGQFIDRNSLIYTLENVIEIMEGLE